MTVNRIRVGRLMFSRALLLSALCLVPAGGVVAETPPGLVAGVISESMLPDSLLQHFRHHGIVLRREVVYGGRKTEWILENADLGPRCEAVTSFVRFPKGTDVTAMRHHLGMISVGSVLNEPERLAMFNPHARGKTSEMSACREWLVKGRQVANQLIDAFRTYRGADGNDMEGVRGVAAVSADLAALQGSWTVVEATMDGKPNVDPALLLGTWTFQGHELLIDSPAKGRARFVLTVQPGAEPKAFHLNPVPPSATRSGWMLFALDGQHLKLAFHDNLDGGRPSGFEAGASHSRAKLIVVTLGRTAGLSQAPGATSLERRDLCGILTAAGVQQLFAGATPSCGVDKKEDPTGVVLEAVAFAPFVSPQNLGGAVQLLVAVPTHPAFGRRAFERERQGASAVGTSQDEPALGAAAFSTVSPKGHVLKIVALKDETFVKLEFRLPVGDPGLVRGFAARVLTNF